MGSWEASLIRVTQAGGFRQDLFGWMDVEAYDDHWTYGIQVKAQRGHAEAVAKLQGRQERPPVGQGTVQVGRGLELVQ